MNTGDLKNILTAIFSTSEQELGCDECFRFIPAYTELTLSGQSPINTYPLVDQHLNRCPDCKEEYHALLVALSH
jgi:hypothetical protein